MKKQLLIVCFVFILIFSGCFDKTTKNYVATIDGEKVYLPEFNVYFYLAQKEFEATGDIDIWDTPFEGGMTAEEQAKERALISIAQIKISAKQAKKMNISLTKDEKSKASEDALNFINNLSEAELKNIGIDEITMTKIMEEKALYAKIYDEITKGYVISEKDFESSYKDYIKTNKDLTSADTSPILDIQYIYIATVDTLEDGSKIPISENDAKRALEKANSALNDAKASKDFTELVQKYSEDAESAKKDGRESVIRDKYVKEFEDAAFSLKEGEISDLIEIENFGYYIIKLNKIKEPELKTAYREKYIKQKKDDIFKQQYDSFGGNKDKIEKNIEVWDSIKRLT